jgi:hypothetical protein
MALKEKVSFKLLVDPDDPGTLILLPVEKKPPKPTIGTMKPSEDFQQAELKNGSVYSVNLKNIEFTDGSIYSNKVEFYTKPDDYMFVEVDDIQSHIRALNIPDENILDHIIDASKMAMYWAKKNAEEFKSIPDFNSPTFQEDYYPFYMYIKHTAMAHAVKEYYIEMITGPKKWKDTLSDLGREEELDFDALRRLLDDLEHEADEWLELVVTITADPKWALRGKYSYAVYNTYCQPYHKISWYKDDYSRGF